MRSNINRRDFLKLFGAAAIGFGFRDFPPGGDPAGKRPPSFRLGRTIYSIRYYDRSSESGKELGFYNRDAVVEILEERLGEPKPTQNSIWLRTKDGWMRSSFVQPVQEQTNEPLDKIPNGGALMEVTVPYTQAWSIGDQGWKRMYRCYYGTTYWVTYAFTGVNGSRWYQIFDERYRELFAVDATHLRPIKAEELSKISPDVTDKHIEIYLKRQRFTAFEYGKPVFTTPTATGVFEGDTPLGEFRVERKTPSRHMASNLEGNEFDLPGVPWVCYIAWTGVSFHGTYWHNNYGTPQSHGCINLTPEAAKWVYRWTDPFVPADENYLEADRGTRVIVYDT
ncbi:MAG: hypothetical protein B6D39_01510 [Anaerolineae bacterium UTCFX2]|jgi:hypothetical protein|nr:L,D-transpeptidase [Anaerolineales bacterium]OQY94414.1 MAG: hypothetical protein B6D39_01510 [Anaerolineae bacterium UTCFX2]